MRHMSRTHSCAGFDDRTPRTRDTDAHFFSSCTHTTHHQRTWVGSKPNGQGHVDFLPPRTTQKSLVRVMFRGTLLELRFSSFCSEREGHFRPRDQTPQMAECQWDVAPMTSTWRKRYSSGFRQKKKRIGETHGKAQGEE